MCTQKVTHLWVSSTNRSVLVSSAAIWVSNTISCQFGCVTYSVTFRYAHKKLPAMHSLTKTQKSVLGCGCGNAYMHTKSYRPFS